jgi:hypothetical protein
MNRSVSPGATMVGNILRRRKLVNDGMLYSISKKGHDMMDVELSLGAVEAERETNDGKQG